MRLRIVTANIFVSNPEPRRGVKRLIERLPWLPPDSLGLQETGLANKKLDALKHYRAYFYHTPEIYLKSNAILVHDRNGRARYFHVDGARGILGRDGKWGVTPPRTIDGVTYQRRRHTITHINTHFHVIPEDEMRGVSLEEAPLVVKQYVEQVDKLIELAKKYKRLGNIVVITADGNARTHDGYDWHGAVYVRLENIGMRVVRNGVDIVAYFPTQLRQRGMRIVDKSVFGSDDHDAIALNLTTR